MLSLPTPPPSSPGPARPGPSPAGRIEAALRRRLRRELATALDEDDLVLHFRPRLSLATGRLTGAEAMVRWPHARHGMVSPATLIPLAEATGQLAAVGGWALAVACRQAAAWPASTIVSVSVSVRQLEADLLLGQVAAALESSGLDPERLELGIAEPALGDIGVDMLLALSAIRDLGVGIALDDFGAAFAGLAMLKRLPLTTVKLDRTLVRDLPHDREDAAIVRAVIATGHAMGLHVIAEGIETEAQRAFLLACGCEEGQGHLFGHAMPGAAFRRL